jgi:hypothetical protein
MSQSLVQTLFFNSHEPEPPGLREALLARSQLQWSKMDCRESKYKGWQSKCKHCGLLADVCWKPGSTKGWLDHQRAHLLSWLMLPVPHQYQRPLEQVLPMV